MPTAAQCNAEIKSRSDERLTLLTDIDRLMNEFDGRIFPAGERETFEKSLARVDVLDAELEQWSDAKALAEKGEAFQQAYNDITPEAVAPPIRAATVEHRVETSHDEQDVATFSQFLQQGAGPVFARAAQGDPGAIRFQNLQADVDVAGGYLITPRVVAQSIIKDMDNMVYMRQLSTQHPLMAGQSLGAPTLDNDASSPEWTSELATGPMEEVSPFGHRELEPHPLAKAWRISNKLIRAPGIDAEAYWRMRNVYVVGIALENAYLNGNGVNQPLGIFTPHANGIPTSRDVNSGHATQITAPALIDCLHSLKAQYWPRVRWFIHRNILKEVRSLQGSDGQFLWGPGLNGGQPQMLLGQPIIMSEYAPSSITTDSYALALGDFSWYWTADSLMMTTQRLVEVYARQNQIGYIIRVESDGMPVLAEAFARMKFAA